jgi:hypothetical protein
MNTRTNSPSCASPRDGNRFRQMASVPQSDAFEVANRNESYVLRRKLLTTMVRSR